MFANKLKFLIKSDLARGLLLHVVEPEDCPHDKCMWEEAKDFLNREISSIYDDPNEYLVGSEAMPELINAYSELVDEVYSIVGRSIKLPFVIDQVWFLDGLGTVMISVTISVYKLGD